MRQVFSIIKKLDKDICAKNIPKRFFCTISAYALRLGAKKPPEFSGTAKKHGKKDPPSLTNHYFFCVSRPIKIHGTFERG